eukprot:1986588-Amphidinium_carterae.1
MEASSFAYAGRHILLYQGDEQHGCQRVVLSAELSSLDVSERENRESHSRVLDPVLLSPIFSATYPAVGGGNLKR